MLNNGPMGNGKLDPEAIRIYGEIGKWMEVNSESIHDTRPNPFDHRPKWGDISASKDGKVLYLHVLHLPETGMISLTDVSSKVTSATYLANGKQVELEQVGETIQIKLSQSSIDPLDTVIKLELQKPLR